MRILVGLQEIAGFFSQLRAGLEECGHQAVFLPLGDSPFQYGGDAPPNALAALARRAHSYANPPQSRVLRALTRGARPALRAALLAWAAANFDVFILHGASTFFRYAELSLLKSLGKKIVYIYLGSDERPPFINGVFISRQMSTGEMAKLARKIKTSISKVERHADLVVGHPLSGQFHERPFLQVMYTRLPYKGPAEEPGERRPGPTRVLHAPSRGSFVKGTPTIRKAIEALRARGHAIDYVEISGRPNAEVQAALRQCDFVVDELYSDVLMAGFATEAAWYGKPAIVGGYENDGFDRLLPPELIPPVLRVSPEETEQAIETLLVDPKRRTELGSRAKTFVRSLDRRTVAHRILDALAGRAPSSAFFDPRNDTRFVHGCAVPRDVLKTSLHSYIAAQGPQALMLDDKPALREQFIRLAKDGVG